MSNERITVFTDTASSITQIEASRLGIGLIPVEIIIDHGNHHTETFNDFTLPPEELYQVLGKKKVTTNAPNPEKISNAFQTYYELGGRKFIFISLSPKNSSIYPNVCTASQQFQETHPDSQIEVVDSKSLCLAQSFKVDKALDLIKSGYSLEEIKKKIDDDSNKNIVLYCSGNSKTAKFIYDSGRVHGKDRFKALAASAISHFNVVPFLTMNPDDGSVSAGIVRGGGENGIKKMIENLYDESEDRKQQPEKFAVAYTQDEEVGSRIVHLLSRRFDLTESNLIKPKEAGSALAVHAGPRIAVLSAIWN